MRAEHPCTALHINETPTHNTVILKMFASTPTLECLLTLGLMNFKILVIGNETQGMIQK